MLIKHKKGGIRLPKYGIVFPKDKAVNVPDKLAERILRNPDFEKTEGSKKKTKKEAGE